MKKNTTDPMISVTIRFRRENMRTFESIVSMYEDSEDPIIARIATTARRRVTKALCENLANEQGGAS